MTLMQSQLEAVRTRLQPHFLFNTLNSVAVLIKENPGQAHDTINDLSDLLRHVLKNMENQFSEVQKEFEFIKKYLAIEQIRFGPRLEIKIDYPAHLKHFLIPSLLLQPLVENAVQYGVAKNPGKGYIEIKAHEDKQMLIFQICNNGHLNAPKNPESGLGLKITKERLQSLYRSAYQFNLDEISDGRIQALIEIPVIDEVVQ
jgi:LytS/YehU family sensor histidine kinase